MSTMHDLACLSALVLAAMSGCVGPGVGGAGYVSGAYGGDSGGDGASSGGDGASPSGDAASPSGDAASSTGVGETQSWGPSVITRTYYEEGTWSTVSRVSFTYEGGRVTKMEEEDFVDGAWVIDKNDRYTIGYDSAGRVAVYSRWLLFDGSDTWLEVGRIHFQRGAGGKLSSVLEEKHLPVDKSCKPVSPTSCQLAWRKDDRWDYAYDAAGHIKEIKKINNVEQDALPGYKHTWTWNAAGKPELKTTYSFEGGEWLETQRTASTYDGQGRLTMTLTHDPDDAGEWRETARTKFSYLEGGQINETTTEYRDSDTWEDDDRQVFVYDNAGRLLSINRFDPDGGGGWTPASRTTLAHTGAGSSWTADHMPQKGKVWMRLKLSWYGQMALYGGQ